MANYSEEDKKAFRLKDLLNSRMSCIKAASIINEGNSSISVEEVLERAQQFFDWLTKEQDFSDLVKSAGEPEIIQPKIPETTGTGMSNTVIPMPTAAQQKMLEYVAKELKTELNDKLKSEVLDFVEQNYQKRIYPGKRETADKFINERAGK